MACVSVWPGQLCVDLVLSLVSTFVWSRKAPCGLSACVDGSMRVSEPMRAETGA